MALTFRMEYPKSRNSLPQSPVEIFHAPQNASAATWKVVIDIPPTRINGHIYHSAAVSDRVVEHNGDMTQAIVRYYVSTLNNKDLSPTESDNRGPVFVRSSNCLLGIAVPAKTAFRDSRFRLFPEEQTIFIFHLCPINEKYFRRHYPNGPTKY